eukprot:UN03471
MVSIQVNDNGLGIEAEQIPRLTEAFYRPDSSRQRHIGGYGLGLYLCKLIVSAHRGEIEIKSAVGKGTQITIRIPLDNS